MEDEEAKRESGIMGLENLKGIERWKKQRGEERRDS